ncbi:MAG TPA: methionine--tRNA ligase, partial [Acidobacteriaceae bacterium]
MPNDPTYYLTTPIYYVNARPHIGHTYTTVVADAIARRRRAQGLDVWFLTGTDEHGQKIERSAEKAGMQPQQFADEVSAQFRGLWDRLGLTYDDYIRTTEERHKRGVRTFFLALQSRGFIYKDTYTGQYCVWDELYVDAAPGAACPDCGRPTETVSEENYFFKLSAFERKLLEYYDEHPEFLRPESRRNEVLAFVRGGLKDLSVSRTSFKWGIPVPGDEKHVIYVWLDALVNYLTALGYGSDDPAEIARFERFWPADLHLMSKEIARFHCVYWPAFLMAAGLPLPKAVFAHGWMLFEQSKMSKSRGNIVRTETILEVFGEQGADALRYFLMREIVFGQDGSFSFDALVQRYNADLANGYGNLVSRTLSMIGKYFGGVVPEGASDPVIQQASRKAVEDVSTELDALNFSRALESAWLFIGQVDGYLSANTPWKRPAHIAEEQEGAWRASLLYTAAESIRILTALVYPILPDAAAKVWAQLGLGRIEEADLETLAWGALAPGTRLGTLAPVFPRAEKDWVARMHEMEQKNTTAPALEAQHDTQPKTQPETRPEVPGLDHAQAVPMPPTPAAALAAPPAYPNPEAVFTPGLVAFEDSALVGQIVPPAPVEIVSREVGEVLTATVARDAPRSPGLPQITIEDFLKVELRVAQIKVAERIPKADKLLRLEVDLGYEQRQILAGIAETYTPESLIG